MATHGQGCKAPWRSGNGQPTGESLTRHGLAIAGRSMYLMHEQWGEVAMNWRNRVEISYGALHHNVRAVRDVIGERALIAVVKADAYGLGVQRCARIYIEAGAAGVAVATVGEARAAAVPGARIMLLGSPLPDERRDVVEGGFEVWVSSKDEILDFAHLGHPERPAFCTWRWTPGWAELVVIPVKRFP